VAGGGGGGAPKVGPSSPRKLPLSVVCKRRPGCYTGYAKLIGWKASCAVKVIPNTVKEHLVVVIDLKISDYHCNNAPSSTWWICLFLCMNQVDIRCV
jgi:hypothetical protein